MGGKNSGYSRSHVNVCPDTEGLSMTAESGERLVDGVGGGREYLEVMIIEEEKR